MRWKTRQEKRESRKVLASGHRPFFGMFLPRALVSSPFTAAGLEDLRLMVFPEGKELTKAKVVHSGSNNTHIPTILCHIMSPHRFKMMHSNV